MVHVGPWNTTEVQTVQLKISPEIPRSVNLETWPRLGKEQGKVGRLKEEAKETRGRKADLKQHRCKC